MYNSDMPTRADLPTKRQLVRSTLIALATSAGLLLAVVLPAEYGIDPTGLGTILNLTEMGEIKRQLAEETQAEMTAPAAAILVDAAPAHPVERYPAGSEPAPASSAWRDEVTLTLAPSEGAEVKLVMRQGETATYEWTIDQGHLNSDLHGDGTNGGKASYRKGRAETNVADELTAQFDGAHGWFWRNRSDVDATVTLRVRGDYSEVKRVL